jgi:hypothetical protein
MVCQEPRHYSLSSNSSSQSCDFEPYSSSEFGSASALDSKRLADWEIEAAAHSLRGRLLELEFERYLRQCDLRKAPTDCVVPAENRPPRVAPVKQQRQPVPARRDQRASIAVCCRSKSSPGCAYPHCDVGWTEIAFSQWEDPIC